MLQGGASVPRNFLVAEMTKLSNARNVKVGIIHTQTLHKYFNSLTKY